MSITLKIKFVAGGGDHPLSPLEPETTILAVKQLLLHAGKGSDSVARQRLIYKGKILKDEETLATHGIKSGETIILQVTKAAASAASPTPPAVASSPAVSTTPPALPAAAAAPTAPAAASSQEDDGSSMYDDPDTSSPADPISGPPEMLTAIEALVAGSEAGVARTGLETLIKVLDNIVSHPTEAKYRTLKIANAVFNRKLGGLPGGRACLLAAGFVSDGEAGTLTLEASAEAWEHLNACRPAIAANMARIPKPPPPAAAAPPQTLNTPPPFGGAAPAFPPSAPFGGGGFGGMPMMPPGGLGGMMPPGGGMGGMDPQMMQQMMSSPMVRTPGDVVVLVLCVVVVGLETRSDDFLGKNNVCVRACA